VDGQQRLYVALVLADNSRFADLAGVACLPGRRSLQVLKKQRDGGGHKHLAASAGLLSSRRPLSGHPAG
jgi:hypothetical protein